MQGQGRKRGGRRTRQVRVVDRAGGAAGHLAHRGRDPLAAADPGPALPGVRRRARRPGGQRRGVGGPVLLRRAGDELPLRELLQARDALEDRLRDARHDRLRHLGAVAHRRPGEPADQRLPAAGDHLGAHPRQGRHAGQRRPDRRLLHLPRQPLPGGDRDAPLRRRIRRAARPGAARRLHHHHVLGRHPLRPAAAPSCWPRPTSSPACSTRAASPSPPTACSARRSATAARPAS